MQLSEWTWSRRPAVVQTKHQNGEESDFGMVVSVRHYGLSISETAGLLGNGPQKQKTCSVPLLLDENRKDRMSQLCLI